MSSTVMVHHTVRLPQDLVDAAKLAAKEVGMSMADYTRFALRQAIDFQARESGLAAMEDRLSAALQKTQRRLQQMQRAQQIHFAMLDEYMKVALSLEPDIPDERQKAAARAVGFRRHRAIVERIPHVVSAPLAQLFEQEVPETPA